MVFVPSRNCAEKIAVNSPSSKKQKVITSGINVVVFQFAAIYSPLSADRLIKVT